MVRCNIIISSQTKGGTYQQCFGEFSDRELLPRTQRCSQGLQKNKNKSTSEHMCCMRVFVDGEQVDGCTFDTTDKVNAAEMAAVS